MYLLIKLNIKMENISEEERDIIKENWSTIKLNAEKHFNI